jgi:hypothetical protein
MPWVGALVAAPEPSGKIVICSMDGVHWPEASCAAARGADGAARHPYHAAVPIDVAFEERLDCGTNLQQRAESGSSRRVGTLQDASEFSQIFFGLRLVPLEP